ncbi:MAG: beta-hydroxyacyl-ACP dehydratase [Planctomycetes bacterium]|nr:beta-hydroxyacyl-ACP dehydratase [Planctomycetota bacterium]
MPEPEENAAHNLPGLEGEPVHIANPVEWIPHRPPILAVDSVDVSRPGQAGTGRRRFMPEEPWLAGHFPGRPIVPGVALIEGIAQTAAIVLLSALGKKGEGVLADVSRFRFKSPVIPPADVTFEVEVIGRFGNLHKVAGKALCGGAVAAEGEVVLSADPR